MPPLDFSQFGEPLEDFSQFGEPVLDFSQFGEPVAAALPEPAAARRSPEPDPLDPSIAREKYYAETTRGERVRSQLTAGVEILKQIPLGAQFRISATSVSYFDDIDAGDGLPKNIARMSPASPEVGAALDYFRADPEGRAEMRAEHEQKFADTVAGIITSRKTRSDQPSHPGAATLVETLNKGDYGAAWRTFADDPLGIIQQFSVESAPASAAIAIPSLLAAPFGGPAAGVTAFLGSLTVENASRMIEGLSKDLSEQGVDINDVGAVMAAMRENPELLASASRRAQMGAFGPAIFDAVSLGASRGIIPGRGIARNTGAVGRNIGVEIATEPAGEALGQFLETPEGEQVDIKLGELAAETLGAGPQVAGTTAVRSALAAFARKPTSDDSDGGGGDPISAVTDADRAQYTQEGDLESPIDTDTIVAGRKIVAEALEKTNADKRANDILREEGLPDIGTRVTVTLPGGDTAAGTVSDGFTEADPELGVVENGIKIDLDNGNRFEEIASRLDQYNIRIVPIEDDIADIEREEEEARVEADAGPFAFVRDPKTRAVLIRNQLRAEREARQDAVPTTGETVETESADEAETVEPVSTEDADAAERERFDKAQQERDTFIAEVGAIEPGFYEDTDTGTQFEVLETGMILSGGDPYGTLQAGRSDDNGVAFASFVKRGIVARIDGAPPGEPTGTGERTDPVKIESPADADLVADQVETDPTEAQKEAQFAGLDITIENPIGSTRSGVDADGKPWSVEMTAAYGYIKRTEGGDGEQIDVYVGTEDTPEAKSFAFVVDQIDPATGKFDEHKVVLGVSDQEAAEDVYDAHFNDGSGPSRRGAVTILPLDEFKVWSQSSDAKTALAYVEPAAAPQEPGEAVTGPDTAETVPEATTERLSAQPDLLGGPEIDEATSTQTVADEALLAEARAAGLDDDLIHNELADLAEGGVGAGATGLPFFLDADKPRDLATIRRLDDLLERGREGEVSKQDAFKAKVEANRAERAGGQPARAPITLTDAAASTLDIEVMDPAHTFDIERESAGFRLLRDNLNIREGTLNIPEDPAQLREMISEVNALANAADERSRDQSITGDRRQAARGEARSLNALYGRLLKVEGTTETAGTEGEAATEPEPQAKLKEKIEDDRREKFRKSLEAKGTATHNDKSYKIVPSPAHETDGLYVIEETIDGKRETVGQPVSLGAAQARAAARAFEQADQSSAGTPSLASKAGDAGGALATEAKVAPPGAQPSPPQVSTTLPPEGVSTTRETDPLVRLAGTRTFNDFEPGAIDTSSNREIIQGSGDFKALLAEAAAREGALREVLEAIVAEIDGARLHGVRVKDEPSMAAKVESKGGAAHTISDYLGGRIGVDGPDVLAAVLAAFDAKFNVLQVENFLDLPKNGYRAVHVQAEIGGNFSVELQILPREISDVIDTTHVLYDKWKRRGEDELLPAETQKYMADIRRVQEIFAAAWRASPFFDATVGVTPAPKTPILEGQDQADDGIQTPIPPSDEGPGTGDVQSSAEDGGTGSTRQPEGERGAEDVRRPGEGQAETPERGGAERGQGEDSGTGTRDTDRVPTGRDQPGEPATGTEPGSADAVRGTNLTIEPGALKEGRGPTTKARDNIRAIELVREIEAEGRPATATEQAEIALYVGWGGLKGIVPDGQGNYGKGFETLGPRLRELLTDTEYNTARRSIQYAHYTSETVVRGMWAAAERLGFDGGMVFEPGMGTGNFVGMMPGDLAANTAYSGLELDHVTTRIARLLYPQSGVRRDDYTRSPLPEDTYDMVIGNPPFADIAIKRDPKYKAHGFLLHDYFFAKSLDGVRPGGLLVFISSAGTLNKMDTKAREYLADRANFVGAIRLPSTAFERNAGTSVTTDIIILRKRMDGEAESNRDWVETVQLTLPDKEGKPTKITVNKWIAEHPEAVLGEQGLFDTLYPKRYGVRPIEGADLAAQIAERIEALPADVMVPWAAPAERAEIDFGTAERKQGSYYIANGRLMQIAEGVGVPVPRRGKGTKGGKTVGERARITELIPVRDALRAVYAADLAEDTENAARARVRLNETYDAFVKKYGPVNKAEFQYRRPTVVQLEGAREAAREEARLLGEPFDEGTFDATPMLTGGATLTAAANARTQAREAAGEAFDEGTFDDALVPDTRIEKRENIDPFKADQESYRLRAIENYDDATGEHEKTDVFFNNVLSREVVPEINSVGDAVLAVLNQKGRLDIEAVAHAAGKTESETIEELGEAIFMVPGTAQTWVTNDEYLSGDVLKKLREAQVAADKNSAFQRNVDALEAVQPAPIPSVDISTNLGMPWIPSATIEQFGTEGLGLGNLSVEYTEITGTWTAVGDTQSASATSVWGTEGMKAPELISHALNRLSPRVTEWNSDLKRSVVDPVATEAAVEKALAIRARFGEWLWEDAARASAHTELYNETANNLVSREFNGDYLSMPGLSQGWEWWGHQLSAISRVIQTGNTYLAHAVGSGKTSTMIGAGMEMRRLGLVRKPLYVVPNHMLGQFTTEFYQLYPAARIMVADEHQFHTSRRKQFIADAANADLDAIIITHSSFGMIPVSHDFQDGLVQQELDVFRTVLAELGDDQDTRFTRAQVEHGIERLEQRLAGQGEGRTDQVLTFEEMGVDFLFVDEAHEFRKLDFATKLSGMKGIDPKGSRKSWDLFVKTRYLETINPGRNLAFASGTPVTNTMAELHSISRYMQPAVLAERGLTHFDAWAGSYGEELTETEEDPAGGYKSVTRFASFVNAPELSMMVRLNMDIVTTEQLKEAGHVIVPRLKGGERTMNAVEKTANQTAYQDVLRERMQAIKDRGRPPEPGDDILLSVIGDGRKAAIDMRLIDAGADGAGSKLNLLVENVFQIWSDTKNQPFHRLADGKYEDKPFTTGPTAQMIFADLGISDKTPINVHKYIRAELIRMGVPRREIAIMTEHTQSHAARQRLFNDVNEGAVRVLIGSSEKMGTGVNAQQRLYAIHNLDPKWYPSIDTQRNGRGLRKGNQNPEIEIHDYSTKGTYDAAMWRMMGRKGKFIEGFFRGDPTLRVIEDLGEASYYEQVAAMTTADPRLIELTELRQKLEKMRRRRDAHERNQAQIAQRISYAESRIKRRQATIPNVQKDIAKRKDTTGDKFTATAGDETFTDRKEFGEKLVALATALVQKKKIRKGDKLGSVGGFDVYASIFEGLNTEGKKTYGLDLFIKRAAGRESTVSFQGSAIGLVQSIEGALRGFDQEIINMERNISEDQVVINDFTPQLGAEYEGGAEIADLIRQVDELDTAIREPAREIAAGAEIADLDVIDADDRAGPRRDTGEEQFLEGQRFSRGAPRPNPRFTGNIDQMGARLQARLKKLGFADRVTLRLAEVIKGTAEEQAVERATGAVFGEIRGLYENYNKLITISQKAGTAADWVMDHEALHALRDLGVIRAAEWASLEKAAQADKGRMKKMRKEREIDGLNEEEVTEEVIADMFADWARGRSQVGGFVKRAFERIRAFITEFGKVMRNSGFREASDIFGRIESGEVGAREPEVFRDPGAVGEAETQAQFSRKPAPQDKTIDRIIGTTDKTLVARARELLANHKQNGVLAEKQGFLDAFASIEALEKEANSGKLQDAQFSPFKAAHATKNLMSVMGAVLRFGPLKIENGWFTLDQSFGKGFEAIFEGLAKSGKLQLWKGWAVAVRAERLKSEGRERHITDTEIAELLPLGDLHPEFKEVMKEWTEFNKRMLDMAEKSGLINSEQRAVWEKSDYIPFFRIHDDAAQGGGRGKRGLQGQRSGIKRLVGGEAQLNDPIENMVMGMTSLVDRSFKNLAMRKIWNLAKSAGVLEPMGVAWKPAFIPATEAAKKLMDMGVDVEALSAEDKKQVIKMFQMTAPQGPDVISVMIDGKPKYARVTDPLLLRSITSLTPAQLSTAMKVLRGAKRVLTTGVTIDPTFMLRNFIRDTQSAWVTAGQKGFLPGLHSVRGFAKALNEDTSLQRLMASGGGAGGFYRTDPDDVRKLMDAKYGKGRKRVLDSPKKLWEFYQRVGQASEAANRIAIFEAVLKSGGTEAEASFQARDVMDFAMRGDFATMRFLAETVPFLNARAQGLYRLYRGAKQNPVGFFLRGSLLMAATLALQAINWDEPEYEELEEWDKDANYHFFVDGEHYRLPKGFEVGAIFGTIPERMVRTFAGRDSGKVATERMLAMVADTFAMNPTPQLVKPLFEQYSNKVSFTGRPIVGGGLDRLLPERQFSPWTSETARLLGKALPGFAPDVTKSPKRIEHMVRGYFGSLGMYLLSASDAGVRFFGDFPEKPAMRIDDYPIAKAFVRGHPARNTVYLTRFYELQTEIQKIRNTILAEQRNDASDEVLDNLENQNPAFEFRKYLNRTRKRLADKNRSIRRIYEDRSMSPIKKRLRIDALIGSKNTIARNAMRYLETSR